MYENVREIDKKIEELTSEKKSVVAEWHEKIKAEYLGKVFELPNVGLCACTGIDYVDEAGEYVVGDIMYFIKDEGIRFGSVSGLCIESDVKLHLKNSLPSVTRWNDLLDSQISILNNLKK